MWRNFSTIINMSYIIPTSNNANHLLDFNELQYPLPDSVTKSLHESIETLDPRQYSIRQPQYDLHLRQKLTAKFQNLIRTEDILLTHGSDDALKLLIDWGMKENDTILTLDPSYTHILTWVNLKHGKHVQHCCLHYNKDVIVPDNVTIVYICSPNNPTGALFPLDKLEKLCINHPHVKFICDEAYGDFVSNKWSAINLVSRCDNLFVVRTFSKLYGLAGLRLGYIINTRVPTFKHLYNPKSVTLLAVKTSLVALDCQVHYDDIVDHVTTTKMLTHDILSSFQLPTVFGGYGAPFLAFHIPSCFATTQDFLQAMIHKGFYLRDRNYLPLMKDMVRISMAPQAVMAQFLTAVAGCLPVRPYVVLLLAAGMGTRMQSTQPKVLRCIGGKTLLNHKLHQFPDAQQHFVVTGYQSEAVKATLDASVTTINNKDYAVKNNYHSLLVGLQHVYQASTADVIVIDGDTIMEQALADQLKASATTHMLIDNCCALTDEAMKVHVTNGIVTACSKSPLTPNDSTNKDDVNSIGNYTGEYIGALRIQRQDMQKVMDCLAANTIDNEYYDTLIGPALSMKALSTMGRKWVEMDTPEDFELGVSMFE